MTDHTKEMLRVAQHRLEREAERAETELRHGRIGAQIVFQHGKVDHIIMETTAQLK